MLRLIVYIVLLAVVVTASVWLADRPGAVSVDWLDWHIDTSVPVLVAILAIVAAVLLVAWRILRWIFGTPGRYMQRRHVSRRHRGYQALAHGLAAAAAGQAKEARRLAGRAEKLLADPSLTAVLSAQAAHLSGDLKAARTHFAALIEHPETEAFGLRGLLRDALGKNDTTAAVDLAQRARRLNPSDSWLAETLYGLLVKAGRIREAEALVDDARKKKAMDPALAARRRAVLAHQLGKEALASGHTRDALDHAKRAVKTDPGFSIGAAALALRHVAAGERRRATRVLAEAWRRSPGPELLAAAKTLAEGETPLAHLRRLEKITKGSPDHPETHKALGEAALAARLWGEARRHFLAALQSHPTQGVYRLLAKLEEQEFNDQAAARAWLDKAAQAAPDASWACTACGTPAKEWMLTCPQCGAVDSMAWVASHGTPAGGEGNSSDTKPAEITHG